MKRHPKRPAWNSTGGGRSRLRENDGVSLPGWSVGYDREISAHAAVQELDPSNGRRRILVMTQDDHEPRDPEAPVELGLYELDDEDDWQLVEYDTFKTPESAVRATKIDFEKWA